MRGPTLGLALVAVLACGEEATPVIGIETRIFVDRTEATVGDPIGVTIEIDTPEGFHVEPPASPPGDESFLSERVELLDPVWLSSGVRHRVVWTLRARSVGEHRLPELPVPISWPDGHIQPLPVGGIPLPVRSVREEVPGRQAYFDIRPAPPLRDRPAWVWVAAGAALLAAIGFLLYRRAGVGGGETDEPAPHLREALAGIQSALAETEPRALAARVGAVLGDLVRGRWSIGGEAWTPEELPNEVDEEIVTALRALEGERFSSRPRREIVLETCRAVQAHLADVLRRS
jgi:hypothetical protein